MPCTRRQSFVWTGHLSPLFTSQCLGRSLCFVWMGSRERAKCENGEQVYDLALNFCNMRMRQKAVNNTVCEPKNTIVLGSPSESVPAIASTRLNSLKTRASGVVSAQLRTLEDDPTFPCALHRRDLRVKNGNLSKMDLGSESFDICSWNAGRRKNVMFLAAVLLSGLSRESWSVSGWAGS